MESFICQLKMLRPCHLWCVHTIFYMFWLDICTWMTLCPTFFTIINTLQYIRLLFFQRCTVRNTQGNYQILLLLKKIRRILQHICTRKRNTRNVQIKTSNQKAGSLSDIFRKKHKGEYNAYSWFHICYIEKCRWLWMCCKM